VTLLYLTHARFSFDILCALGRLLRTQMSPKLIDYFSIQSKPFHNQNCRPITTASFSAVVHQAINREDSSFGEYIGMQLCSTIDSLEAKFMANDLLDTCRLQQSYRRMIIRPLHARRNITEKIATTPKGYFVQCRVLFSFCWFLPE
jgi:hypothetical protein